MPRRKKRGQGPRMRGRHKSFRSRETRIWNRLMRAAKDANSHSETSP